VAGKQGLVCVKDLALDKCDIPDKKGKDCSINNR
jgi:hypothetical protein